MEYPETPFAFVQRFSRLRHRGTDRSFRKVNVRVSLPSDSHQSNRLSGEVVACRGFRGTRAFDDGGSFLVSKSRKNP